MQQESRDSAASPASAPSPTQQPKKRKSTNPTSRGVATLTAEQLAKKRANDREAQRAIRERTKSQIETLERRIQELTSQQPYQELQAVIRQKDAIQAENEEIRRRLASIMSIVQPVMGAQGLTDLAAAAQTNLQLGLAQNGNLFDHDQYHGQNHNGPSPTAMSSEQHSFPHSYSEGMTDNEKLWQSSGNALGHQRNHLNRNLELNDSERLTFNFLLDGSKRPPAIHGRNDRSPSQHGNAPAIASTYSGHQTSWTTLPRNIAPTCPLDGILLKFLQTRQQEVGNGASQSSLAGPAYPSVSSLLNPALGRRIDPLSQLMTDIISKFPAICGLPEQVGIIYFMFLVMKWMIYPTQANYERMPDWLTPRPSQLFTPHPAWIDYLPWPRLRDKLVDTYIQYPFENWFIPFTSGLSVNWPYEPIDCLLVTSDHEESTINPVFERHLMRMDNWSVGPSFVEAFPALVDTVRVKQEQGMRTGEQPP